MGCVCCKEEETLRRKNSTQDNDLDDHRGHVNEAADVDDAVVRYANEPTVARQRENPIADKASRRRTILSPHHIEILLAEGKQVAKALYNYTGSSDDGTMDMSAGEVLEILSWDGDWCFAKNLETDDEGFVPRTYVALENSLGCHGWFHGEVSRADAVKMLKAPTNKAGTFLIRQSETKEGSYSLSLLYENSSKGRTVKHYRIRNMDFGGCFLYESRTFDSLVAMVDHYAKYDDDRLSSLLLFSCPKQQPTILDLSRATRDNWEIPKSEIELIELLGAGNFGEVWKGRWKRKIDVAVKTMKTGTMEPERFLEEAAIMKQLQHPKVIRLYAVCTQEHPFYIISELMPNGSLKNHLTKNNDIGIQEIVYTATQVADGMWYIEREGLIHRDLAARNVLMGDNGLVKICDFGMAKVINEDVYIAQQGAKCPLKWTAPEAINYQKYSIKSDVWSFGILLVELTNGNGGSPYPGMTNQHLLSNLAMGYRHPQPKNCPENLYDDVMLRCWNENPDERPSFEELCRHLEDFPVD